MALPSLYQASKLGLTPAGTAQVPVLTPERRNELLSTIGKGVYSGVEHLGLALDTPAALLRGALVGDPLSAFNWSFDKRTGGKDVLAAYGLTPENDTAAFWAGLATEMVLDPLLFTGLGKTAVTAAGDAARAASVLDLAPQAYMRKFGTQAAEDTLRGGYVTKLLAKESIPTTAANYKVLSPVGQRVAQSKVTLADVIAEADDPAKALTEAVTRLGGQSAYDAAKDQTLGGLVGFNFGKTNLAIAPPGTNEILDLFDYAGARGRFSPLGRFVAATGSRATKGLIGTGDQLSAMRASQLEQDFTRLGREKAVNHNMLLSKIKLSPNSKTMLGSDSLFSEQGNSLLTRLAEGKGNPKDLQILADTPELKQWLSSWEKISAEQGLARQNLGLAGKAYGDRFGTKYSPRYGDEFDFESMKRTGKGEALFSAKEAETRGRKPFLQTPGGTDDLRELSLLPQIGELVNGKISYQEAGKTIKGWFDTKYPLENIGKAQSDKIARVLMRLKKDLPAGTPAFAAHPANAQARRIIGHEIARSRANFILEALAESAVKIDPQNPLVGQYRNLASSFDEVGRKTGFDFKDGDPTSVLKIFMDKIGGQGAASSIDLASYVVPERVVRRLERVSDVYKSSEVQQKVLDGLDMVNVLFKNFALNTRPARFVRDLYSNAVSLFLETGDIMKVGGGMSAARHVMAGNYKNAVPALRAIPEFAGITDDALLVDTFLKEAGTEGVLSGLRSSDILSSSRTGEMGQLIPGSTPVSVSRGLGELVPDLNYSGVQRAKDFFTIDRVTSTYGTRNPILRAGNAVGDAVDSIGRLGGFIALRQQGIGAREAAKRVAASLIDYGSMTTVERNWLGKIFPWYAYNSRIGAYMAKSLFDRPGGLPAQMFRANNAINTPKEGEYVPTKVRDRFAVDPPEFLKAAAPFLFNDQDGTVTKITDADLPAVDLINLFNPTSLQKTTQNFAGQLNPLLKAGIEYISDRDLYQGRPLGETTRPIDRVAQAMGLAGPEGVSKELKILGDVTPLASQLLQIGGQLTDPRSPNFNRRAARAFINWVSGIKLTDVDKEFILRDMQEKIHDRQGSKSRSFDVRYTPKASIERMNADELEDVALDKEITKMREELRKNKTLQPTAQLYR